MIVSDKFYCGHGIPYDNSLAASNGQVDVRFWSGNYVSGGDSGFELHYNVYRTGGSKYLHLGSRSGLAWGR